MTDGPAISRRSFLGFASATALSAGLGGALAIGDPAGSLEISRLRIELPFAKRPPSGMRIVQVSDLHRSPGACDEYLHACLKRVAALEPDLILLTGDYITTGDDRREGERFAALLSILRAPLGTFAILGNHDGSHGAGFSVAWIADVLRRAGISLLVNRSVLLRYRGLPFTLVGLADFHSRDYHPSYAFDRVETERAVIVMSHNPHTHRDLVGLPVDFMLAGHTHGGQIRLPFVPIRARVRDPRFVAGLVRLEKFQVYVNRGLGGIPPRFRSLARFHPAGDIPEAPAFLYPYRVNCPPEIALFQIA